jgi:hypothetical protein
VRGLTPVMSAEECDALGDKSIDGVDFRGCDSD